VLLDKTGAELDTVVQLVIDDAADVRVDAVPFEVCSGCGGKDYHRSCRGFPPSPAHTKAAAFKSKQYFNGSNRRVYVTNGLYQRIVAAQLKGAEFDPCEPPSGKKS
jgi:hypothetical protein